MSEKDEFFRIMAVKKCPNCGGKLDKGYFTAVPGMYWDKKKHGLIGSLRDRVSPGFFMQLDLVNAPALRCERCGIAILDYGMIGKTPRSFLKKCVECGETIPIASEYCPKCGAKQEE
jgi:ribosomal protein L32